MKLFLCSLLVFISQMASAQYAESLVSDRPGQSISPNTVGKNIFQIQAGYNYDNAEKNIRSFTFDFPNKVTKNTVNNNGNAKIRYGIFDRFELSAQATFGQSETTYSNRETIELDKGIQLLGFAARGNLLNSENGKFSLGSEFEVLLAPNDDDDNSNELHYSYVLVTMSGGYVFTQKLSATANMGLRIEKWSELFFTANIAYAALEKLGVFVEYYPVIGDNQGTTFLRSYLNSGLYYSISPNFMLDLAGSFLVSDHQREDNFESDQFIVQFGLSYRIGKAK